MKTMKTMKTDELKSRVEGFLLKKPRVDFMARIATLTAAATLSTSAWAEGPITLWYQRGGNRNSNESCRRTSLSRLMRRIRQRRSHSTFWPAEAVTKKFGWP